MLLGAGRSCSPQNSSHTPCRMRRGNMACQVRLLWSWLSCRVGYGAVQEKVAAGVQALRLHTASTGKEPSKLSLRLRVHLHPLGQGCLSKHQINT